MGKCSWHGHPRVGALEVPVRRSRLWRPRIPVGLLVLVALLVLMVRQGWTPSFADRALRQATTRAFTQVDLYHLSEQVRIHHLVEERYPADFRTFLASSRKAVRGRQPWQDAWGGEYLLEPGPRGFEVRSPGPDRLPYTRDDLVVKGEVLPKDAR